MRIAMTLLALGLSLGACKKKETKPTGDMGSAGSAMAGSDTGSAGSADTGSAGSAAMAGSDTGSAAGSAAGSGEAPSMSKKAGNCPSTVLGATTKAEVKGKDVVVMITSSDKDAVAAIQKRSEELLAEKKDHGSGGGHDQKGTHGGGTGMCPVHLPEGATATAKNEKDGVAITITPKDKPEDLKKDVDARIAKTEEWVKTNIKPGEQGNQGGVGGGKGEHGANHTGEGDSKGKERKGAKGGDGKGGGEGTGGGGGKGTGGGGGSGKGSGSAK